MLTFVRTTELRAARWDEVDLEAAEWRIPAERMKMRDPHIVPLSRQAVETFAELRSIAGRSDYVFPSPGAEGCMSNNTIWCAAGLSSRLDTQLRAQGREGTENKLPIRRPSRMSPIVPELRTPLFETRRRFVGAKLREISLQALEERLKHIAP